MTMTASVSVIIPTHNRRACIGNCLRSLENGGIADLEIIVVDDGSTDGTEQALEPWAGRIKYLRQENAGPSAARNGGFRHSLGRYVSFVDSDDQWLPGAAAPMVELLDAFPEVDIVFADAHVGNDVEGYQSFVALAGEGRLKELPARRPRPGFHILEPRAFFRRLVERNHLSLGAALVRREAFASVGGYDPDLRHAEDWELCLRMAGRSNYAYWDHPVLIYHKHTGGLTSQAEQMQVGFVRALQAVLRKCDWLSAEDRDLVEHQLGKQMFSYGYTAYDRHDYSEAFRRFSDTLQSSGWQGRAWTYRQLCRLPGGVVRSLRELKHLMARA
jgi:glycosyltransferase involved in cell wall biosynthesis